MSKGKPFRYTFIPHVSQIKEYQKRSPTATLIIQILFLKSIV